MSPGGLRGLQIRRGALRVLSVGSTPIRSRQYLPLLVLSAIDMGVSPKALV